MFCCVIICSLWERKVSPALVICVYIWRAVWKVCTGVWCPVKPVLVFGTEGQETFWSHLGSLLQGWPQSSGVGRNQWSVGGHRENEVALLPNQTLFAVGRNAADKIFSFYISKPSDTSNHSVSSLVHWNLVHLTQFSEHHQQTTAANCLLGKDKTFILYVMLWQCSFKGPVFFHPQWLLWRLRPEPNLCNTVLTQRSVPGDRDRRQVRSSHHTSWFSCRHHPGNLYFVKWIASCLCAQNSSHLGAGEERDGHADQGGQRLERTVLRLPSTRGRRCHGVGLFTSNVAVCRVERREAEEAELSGGSQERNNIQTATLFLFVYTSCTAGFKLKFSWWWAVCYCMKIQIMDTIN